MRGFILILCVGVLSMASSGFSWASEKDFVRSEIEVYGNIKFLMRIAPDEKFATMVYQDEQGECFLNPQLISQSMKQVLAKNARYTEDDHSARFRVDFDYFVEVDQTHHCLMAYEIYITRNIQSDDALAGRLDDHFDYENSNPLLKINGILHTDKDVLNETLLREVEHGTKLLLESLKEITAILKN